MCTQQETFGGLLPIDVKENMNSGKVYFAFKYMLEVALSVWRYATVIKTDDDTVINLPNLAS